MARPNTVATGPPAYKLSPEVERYVVKARDNLGTFAALCYKDFRLWPYTIEMVKALMRLDKRIIRKLMIFCPPRHGKSTLVSKVFPCWYLGRHPGHSVIHTSYNDELSHFFSLRVRGTIETEPLYKCVFPETQIPAWSRAVDMWSTTQEGLFLSSGLKAGITGFGGNLVIIDDPVKNPLEAHSRDAQEKQYDTYLEVVHTRFEPNSVIILMMTRWDQMDLAGRILENEKDWVVLHFRAIENEGTENEVALCPDRYPIEVLRETRRIHGGIDSSSWQAMYQGNPLADSAQAIKAPWIRWYSAKPSTAQVRVGGMDVATELKEVNDDTCLVVGWKDFDGILYVENVFRGKWTVKETANLVVREHKRARFTGIKLEKNGAGEAVRQAIMECGIADGVLLPINASASKVDKGARLKGVSYLVETGKVFFRQGIPVIEELVKNLLNFPQGAHDDDVDAFVFMLQEGVETKADIDEEYGAGRGIRFDERRGEYVHGDGNDDDGRPGWGNDEGRHIARCRLIV